VDYSSTLINQGVSIFGNITDPTSMSKFLKADPAQILHPENKFAVSTSFLEKARSALTFVASPLVETFGKVSSSTVLILFSFICVVVQRNSIARKEWWLGGFSLMSFYIVNLVNKVRYLDAPQYRLFSEFFLFTFALLVIYKMPPHAQKRTLGILIFLVVLANLAPYTHYYNWLIRKGSHPFCKSGLISVHPQMDIKRIELECAQSSKER
jgi:hypothetical protein